MSIFSKLFEFIKFERSKKNNIHPTAIVYPNVILGDNVYIGAYSVIGAPAEVKGLGLKPMGLVYIGDKTIIREHVTIHSPRTRHGKTMIGHSCFIQSHSHIGHDCVVNSNSTIACYACLGGHTILDQRANMGLHSVTHPRAKIGEGTIVGCNSFVKGEALDWSVYVGSPAKRIKANNHLRNKLNLPLINE